MKKHKSKDAQANCSTVAVVQAASVVFDRKQTLERALDLTRDAARHGARLVLQRRHGPVIDDQHIDASEPPQKVA